MNPNWNYLMHIGFDNSSRLMRHIYYFEYKNVKFKLIQNVQKYKDVLLSILSHYSDQEVEKVFDIASEFLSALAWENNSLVTVRHVGGHSSGRVKHLKQARCSICTFRTIPRGHGATGYSLQRIPEIENSEQKLALALYREASSSLNPYLAFLFYWHILEIGQKNKDRIKWINDVYRHSKVYIDDFYAKQFPLEDKSLGEYFQDDCRHAIAHIIRGKKTFKLDSYLGTSRMAISTMAIEKFSKYYIKENLNLKKNLFLVRKSGRGFPIFLREAELRKVYYTVAYKEKLK